MPRFHSRMMAGVTLTSVLNSSANDDEEARRKVMRIFGTLLGATCFMDVACAFCSMWVHCLEEEHFKNNNDDHTASIGHCIGQQILDGFRFKSPFQHGHNNDTHHNGTGSGAEVGDLFLLAVVRCAMTVFLLWFGVHHGRYDKSNHPDDDDNNNHHSSASHPQQANDRTSSNEIETAQDENALTTPLLNSNTIDNDQQRAAEVSDQVASSLETQHHHGAGCCCTHTKSISIKPSTAKNLSLLCLFVASTMFQIYVGLKVANYYHPSSSSTDDTAAVADEDAVVTILMSLTVLWINLECYLFRTLLSELTREKGLFLSNQVHRHPVFFRKFREMAMNWCDVCHTRIKSEDPGCYRCPLCDFDICLACSRRADAMTVGENVLRGDRGVRVEADMDSKSYFWRSLQVASNELPLLLISFVLLTASSISQLLLPHFQGHIIDKVIPNPNNGAYDRPGFKHYIQIYIVVMLVQGALSTLYSAIFTLVSRRLKFTIRNSLFERILSQDVAYFDGTESGRLISRLTYDLDLMMSPIQSSLSSLLSNVLILVGGMVMCFVKSYRLSLLAFVMVGPITYLWERYAIWSKGLAKEMLGFWAEGNSIASQALSHIRTVKAFGCEDKVIRKYSEANKQALHCGVKDAWGNGATSALTGYLDLGSGVLILYFGGLLVYGGEMSVGTLVTFQLFWNMMNNAYQNLQGLMTSFTRSAAGAEKVFSLWDSEPDINPNEGSDITWDVKGHLELKNVTYFYQMRPDNLVLKEFSLDIPAGKTVALVGRSGGGKSTIINLLLRFYDARVGKILLDGREYPSLKVHQLRRLFGVVTQETELFALTVKENITYGLDPDEYTMEDVINAAKKAHAHEFIISMKDGYSTRIGERGNRLSGGQRQRIAIARVFIRSPRIILLDEATSALDEHSQEAVQGALSTLIAESNATVVLVAHRLSTVQNADNIVVIDKGVALEQGNHEELIAKGGIYASMVQKQNKKKADQLDQETQDDTEGHSKKKAESDNIDDLLADPAPDAS